MPTMQRIMHKLLVRSSVPDMLLPTEHAAKKAEAEQRRKEEAAAKAAAKETHHQRIVHVSHHCTLQKHDSKHVDINNVKTLC